MHAVMNVSQNHAVQVKVLRLHNVVCSTSLSSKSPTRHARPSRRAHSKTETRLPSAGLHSDNEQLKAELQRIQKDIEVQLKDLH